MNIFYIFILSCVLSFTPRDQKAYIQFLANGNGAQFVSYQKIERILSDESSSELPSKASEKSSVPVNVQ
ncbi:hypothetical protein, partial [Plasmodium yoelii yoelii]